MITVFNRKALIKDTNAEAVAAVWSKLRANGIGYDVVTKTGTSSFRRMMTQRQNVNFQMGGVPAAWTEHPGDYLYIVYVNKKDLAKAKELCGI